MRSNWINVMLDDIADVIMGQSPKSEYYNNESIGLPFFQGCSEFGELHPTVNKYCSKPTRVAQKDDVLMSVRAPVGDLNISDRECCIGRGLCAIRSKTQNRFIYYLLRANIDLIQTYGSGTTYQAINKKDVNNLPFRVPPLPIQRKIASILSAYDDLIVNNKRRIQILEEMAQRIYREWFVNFRYPDFEENKLIESELGMIPEEWDVKTVSQAVEINPRISVPRDTNKPYVPMSGLNKNTMLITEYEIRKGNSGSKFQNKDVLMARITPSLEHGKTAYVQFLGNDSSVAIGSTEFIVMRSKSLNSYFVYCLARNENLRQHAIKSMVGASGRQRVQMECFDSFLFTHPDNNSLIKFSFIAEPIFKLIQRLWEGIQKLRKIRDFLLPKLISGKIDLSELDIDIGEMDESL